jgi:hypothetical protein
VNLADLNSSIFSFDGTAMLQELIISTFNAFTLPGTLLLVFLAAAAVITHTRVSPAAGRLIFLLVLIAAGRTAVFDNPVLWTHFERRLNAGLIGWRQYDLLVIKRDSFLEEDAAPKFLAVGSSQTGAIYSSYSNSSEQLEVYAVAAMMPLDFLLHSSEILKKRPQWVMLYLSEFDLAKGLTASALEIAPDLGREIIREFPAIARAGKEEGIHAVLLQLLLGQLSPEYKYRFVFRGLLEREIRRVARGLSDIAPPKRPSSTQEQRMAWIRESLAAENIDFNVSMLDLFIQKMAKHDISIAIVEGHFNPLAMNSETRRLRQTVLRKLEEVSNKSENVRFIPREDVYSFSALDYSDLTHVESDIGEVFAGRVVEILEQIENPNRPGSSPKR